MSSIVYLAGFMGAGKSTVGPILANTLGWEFIDLDLYIESKTGKKIKEIFSKMGEQHFRKIETESLMEVSKGRNLIIALGGGTIAGEKNFSIIKNSGKIVYLKTSPENIYSRLKNKLDRPVLLNNIGESLSQEEFMKKIDLLFRERLKYYEGADITIDTDATPVGKTVDQLAHIILRGKKF